MESRLKIQENVSLAPLTTFRIGGPARYFVEVRTEEELLEALNYARDNKLEIFVLGGGSNVLISDEGFSGLVVRIKNDQIEKKDNWLVCGAGASLSSVVGFAKENSLYGLAWAAGIPGSVGGAIRGNAGAFGGEMKDSVREIHVIRFPSKDNLEDKIETVTLRDENCEFGYRDSIFKRNPNLIIWEAKIKLEHGNRDQIEKEMLEVIAKRKEKQPADFPSAGSFFQNPEVKNPALRDLFERETGKKLLNEKIPAGWLIEEAGFRGKTIGGAAVSQKHSNFVINVGNAKAQDVVILDSMIKQKVRTKFEVQLREEVKLVGF